MKAKVVHKADAIGIYVFWAKCEQGLLKARDNLYSWNWSRVTCKKCLRYRK